MNRTLPTPIIAIVLAAGTAIPAPVAAAQSSRAGHATMTQHESRALGFYKSSKLMGMDIRNANGEVIGTVDDIILDRGDGVLKHIVLSNGGFLGIGDKRVAVPYEAFGFDRVDRDEGVLTLNATPEQIESAREFEPSRWVDLDTEHGTDALADAYREAFDEDSPEFRDPFAESLSDAEEIDLKGRIVSVDRKKTWGGTEQVSVTLIGGEGGARTVVFGPSWYVMGQKAAPMRGDEIRVKGYELKRDGKSRIVASRATIGGDDLVLRDTDAKPRWFLVATESSARSESSREPASPMMFLSDLIGKDARARDEDGGEIVDSVIEAESGRVAMLTLDPNEAVLGIGDTLRCVPWSISAVGEKAVWIDADTDMLARCKEMPDDVGIFGERSRLESVYGAFDVEPAEFEPREHRSWNARDAMRGWSADSDFAEAVRDGRSVTMNGTVTHPVVTARLEGLGEARAVQIRTSEGPRAVVIGPAWYLDRQDFSLDEGDRVEIKAKRVRHNGREFYVARELTRGGKTHAFWTGDSPIWDAD